MNDGTTRFHHGGRDVNHFMLTSTFSQYTVVHQEALAKIRDDAPAEKACLFGCAVTTGIGAALWTAKVKAGQQMRGFRRRADWFKCHSRLQISRRRNDYRR